MEMSLDDPFYITGRVDLSLAMAFRSQVSFCVLCVILDLIASSLSRLT